MGILRKLKLSLLRGAQSVGVDDRLAATEWRRRRLLILCYHGVSLEDEHECQPRTWVSPALFEERLRFLRDEKFNVLPLGDAIERLTNRALPPRAVAITFDDGFYDFQEQAWPLLRKYDFPATVYLTTYYSAYNRPIFRLACSYMLWRNREKTIGPDESLGLSEHMPLKTLEEREAVLKRLSAYADQQGYSGADRDALAQKVAGAVGFDFGVLLRRRIFHILRPEEVTRLSAEGLDVQLHTHRHRTPADKELFQREIRENRERILEYTGKNPVHFCYPNGRNLSMFPGWLAEMNVASATTTRADIVEKTDNAWLLPRYLDDSLKPMYEVASWLAGTAALL